MEKDPNWDPRPPEPSGEPPRGDFRLRAAVAAQIHRATFPLPEGLVALEIPERLSAESFEDLEAWLQVMLRRARRSVGEKAGD